MRKSLIITAALMVSSLFAGSALADETSRGAEKPSLRADKSDGARLFADKLRARNDYQGRAVTTKGSTAERKLDNHRQKGDMVDEAKNRSNTQRSTQKQEMRSHLHKSVSEKRADIQDQAKKRSNAQNNSGKRAFTVANDRRSHAAHDGPKTIVDVMARRELLKFLGATGVKVNCSQTGTCTEETPM